MNEKKVLIEFTQLEFQQVMSIVMDEDSNEALSFIKGVLVKRMEKALRKH